MFLETIICLVVLSLYSLHYYIRGGRRGKLVDKIPGPRSWPIIGNTLQFSKMTHAELWYGLRKMNEDYYPIYRMWFLTSSVINIRHPDDAEVLLSSTKHIKKSLIYEFLHPWFGTGLLTSTGAKWQKRRKIITPAFHFNILRKYFEIITSHGEKFVSELKENTNIQDIIPLLTNYTLNVICEAAMGASMQNNKEQKQYRNAIHEMGEVLVNRLLRPWLRPSWLFCLSKYYTRQRGALKVLHGFSSRIINERKEFHTRTEGKFLDDFLNPVEPNNEEFFSIHKKRLAMLDLLISAQRNGDQIDDLGIREEVDTFMFEGHDTSAMGLCFSLLLLAEHKNCQEKVREEVDSVLDETGGKIGIYEVQRFTYLDQCVKEALRLYPSVPFISREMTEDLQLKKYLIPKNAILHLHVYDLHRDPNFWPAPEVFDPDRFLPENMLNRHPFSYIPFSAGPRNCIGQKFAMLELKAVIAHLVRNFYLEPIDLAHEVQIVPDLVLRPAKPVKLKLIPIER